MLPLAATCVPVLILLIGSGLDMGRLYKARNRLQSACDAGALAGRRSVSSAGYDDAAKAQAAAFFNANFNEDDLGATETNFATSSADGGSLVEGIATTDVEMVLMNLFGVISVPINVECSATMDIGNTDVTMVLDTTGSMSQTLSGTTTKRIDALRTAMKNFYDTVSAATTGSNARVRYSFVPYSSSVNVGQLIYDLDPDYLVDTWAIQSRTPVFNTVTEQILTGYDTPVTTTASSYSSETTGNDQSYSSTRYNSLSACNTAKPADVAWANYGSATQSSTTTTNSAGQQIVTVTVTQPQRKTTYTCQMSGGRYRIYYYYTTRNYYTYTYNTSNPVYTTVTSQVFSNFAYKQINVDVSSYKKFQTVTVQNGTNGANVSYTWKGCIEERDTEAASSFSYSTVDGMSPSTALDLDIDRVPDSDPATKWAPMWPELGYYRTASSRSSTPVSTLETTSGSQLSAACPYKAQLLQTMSQSAFYAYADALSANGSTYHDLGMLWGLRLSSPDGPWQAMVNETPENGGEVSRHIIFMTDGQMDTNYKVMSTYGIEWHDRRITDDGVTDQDARHTLRFRALCDAAKAKGFRVWVIAFASDLNDDLSYCASASSTFPATNATELNTAFQEIAKNVAELRVYQ